MKGKVFGFNRSSISKKKVCDKSVTIHKDWESKYIKVYDLIGHIHFKDSNMWQKNYNICQKIMIQKEHINEKRNFVIIHNSFS